MLRSTRLSRRSLLVATSALLLGKPALAARHINLFVIARSLNANVVHYDANLNNHGWLDETEPLLAYWVMHAEQRQREELGWFERQFAYGFSIVSEVEPQRCELRLTALSERPVVVRLDAAEKPRAYAKIAGRPAILRRIFVQLSGTGPNVRHVTLSGIDTVTRAAVRERIEPT